MKKLMMLTILLLPIFVFGMEYHDSSINLTMNVDNYMVFTRENLKNNTDLDKLKITEEQMMEIMNKNSIYFDIIPEDLSHEILVVIISEKNMLFNNLANASDSFLNELGNELAKRVGLDKSDIYKNEYAYIIRDYYDSKSGYNIINYYTVVNAKGYNFQLQKKERITDDEKNNFKKMIDSVDIEVLDEYKNESEEVKKALNNDNKSGFDWKNILIKSLIGALIGGLGGFLLNFINKKIKKI